MTFLSNPSGKIRVDDHSGYFRLADLYQHIREGKFISSVWLSASDTINFIIAWESLNNPHYEEENFREIIANCGRNAYFLHPKALVEAGAIGLFLKSGPRQQVYIHPDWAIHFAGWISPAFRVKSIQLLRQPNTSLGSPVFRRALVAAFIPGSDEEE